MNVVMFFLATISAFFAAFISTPIVIDLAKRFNLVDDVTRRKHPANTHTGVIPRAGGLAIYAAVIAATFLFIPLNQILVGVLLGGFLILLMGILDDYFDLSASSRMFMNFLIVGIVILFGLGVPYITNPLGGVIQLDQIRWTINFFGEREFLVLANIFSLLWIVGIMNFVNWSSGVDGQLAGFTGISSFFLGMLALRFTAHDISTESVAMFALIVSGAYLGFLPWNFYPQKIMPGYSGGALAGFFLGVLSILSWGKIGTMILVLSVPLVDALYILIRRIKNKQSPFKGDAGHFHHRLLQIGWGRRRIAVFYWIVSFLFGIAALYLEQQQKLLAVVIVTVFLALFIVITNRLKTRQTR